MSDKIIVSLGSFLWLFGEVGLVACERGLGARYSVFHGGFAYSIQVAEEVEMGRRAFNPFSCGPK